MRTSLKSQLSNLSLRPLYPIFALWTINLILVGVVLFGISQLTTMYGDYTMLKDQVVVLQSKAALVNENRKIDQAELDRLNGILAKLIPDDEDYFLVISALEKLSAQTGFSLSRYNLNLSASTAEKLSLSIDGSGDSESFLKLLNTYQYGGGRLITNESLDFSPANLGSVRLLLNFYHKTPASVLDTENKKITQTDFELIQSIEQKMNQNNN